MRYVWIVFVWVNLLSLSPALAQLYRWTDKSGRVHITDDQSTIPPAYRDQVRSSTTDQAAPDGPSAASPPLPAAPQSSQFSPWTAPPGPAQTAVQSTARQRVHELEQEIASARQERQRYLDQLGATPTVHTTPRFVRQRRQIAELGRALVAVEQRLDALALELERLQPQLALQASAPAVERTRQTGFDATGYDAAAWQRRARTLSAQLQDARSKRRAVLAQLTAITDNETGPAERQGRELLQYAEALQRLEADIASARQAWQNLVQEAEQAAVPPEWLQ